MEQLQITMELCGRLCAGKGPRCPARNTALKTCCSEDKAGLIRHCICQTSAKVRSTMSGGCSSGSGLEVESPGMARGGCLIRHLLARFLSAFWVNS